MTRRLPEPLVSATITRGTISSRVKRVRTTRAGVAYKRAAAAATTRQAADAIAAQRAAGAHLEPAKRPRRRLAVEDRRELRTPGLPAGWHQICVCMPADVVRALDAAIERCAAAGAGSPSRSRLIRIALGRLDVADVVAELKRNR